MAQTKVNIVTLTYNQENVIAQTIDALLAQKTNFDFEIIIGEDASTDNTLQIVKAYKNDYPEQIRIISADVNIGLEKNYLRCFEACSSDFVAYCDGDDIWLDPLKLQKQVDFLEEHEDYGLLGTNFVWYDERLDQTKNSDKHFSGDYKTYAFDEMFLANPLSSSSVVFRNSLLKDFLQLYYKNKKDLDNFIDYSLWLFFASKMKVAELKDISVSYRLSKNSISQVKDFNKSWKYRKRNYKHFKFFADYFKDHQLKNLDKAYYNRALWYYKLAAVNKDKTNTDEFAKILLQNKDYIRYMLLKFVYQIPKAYFIANIYDKITARFKFNKQL